MPRAASEARSEGSVPRAASEARTEGSAPRAASEARSEGSVPRTAKTEGRIEGSVVTINKKHTPSKHRRRNQAMEP